MIFTLLRILEINFIVTILMYCKKGRPPLLHFFLEIVLCLMMDVPCARNM
jgi:hypothetical protein